jgi:ABC-type transport system involved in multi-copper enzyme maturation permease subunit
MTNLVRAELMKFRTTRMVYGLLLGMSGSVALGVAGNILGNAQQRSTPLNTADGVASVLSNAGSGAIFVLVLGVLCLAGEFRHNTVTSAFLTTPDRRRVLAAKLVSASLVGVAFGVAGSVLTLAIAVPWLSAKGVGLGLIGQQVGLAVAGALLTTALYGLIGVGIGALVRNAIAAVAGALVWMAIIENLVVSLRPQVGKWLPGGAASALAREATPAGGLLPMWAGGALLLGYAIAFAVVGTRFVLERDVT